MLHDTIDFGNSTQLPDVSLLYSNENPSGVKLTAGKILHSDIIGATAASAIQSKSGITLDPGFTLKSDYVAPSTTDGAVHVTKLQLDADSTIYVDNIRPNPISRIRFITTGGLAVDPAYGIWRLSTFICRRSKRYSIPCRYWNYQLARNFDFVSRY